MPRPSTDDGATAGPASPGVASPEEAQALIEAGDVSSSTSARRGVRRGHIAGAENIDFYAADFADRIDALDQRVGTSSTATRESQRQATVMADEGFTSVTDVDGGIAAWKAAGLPTVTAG